MKQRCENPSDHAFRYYGAKGIRVCEEWQTYAEFKEWAAANGYQEHLSIDRLNADLGYAPDNCEWVTRSENSRRANVSRWAKHRAAT